jgi:hypothetical protein
MQIDVAQNTTTTGVVTFSFSNAVETWRLQRLIKVYSYITSMYDHEEYFHLITRMHDHKGELTVTVSAENCDLSDVVCKLWGLEGEIDVKIVKS